MGVVQDPAAPGTPQQQQLCVPRVPGAAGPGLQLALGEECSCPALSTLWRGLCSASMSLTFSVLCDSIGCGAALGAACCRMSLWGLGGNGQPIKIWNIEKVRAVWWGHNNSQNFSGIASVAASPWVCARVQGLWACTGWWLHCVCSWGRAELSRAASTSVRWHIGCTSAGRVGQILVQKEPSEHGLCLHLCGGRGKPGVRVFPGTAGRFLP